MAEESQKVSKIPTNEEVIEELTKDLASAAVTEKSGNNERETSLLIDSLKDTEKRQELQHNDDLNDRKTESDFKDECCATPSELNEKDGLELNEDAKEESEEEKNSKIEEEDFIDEVALKDAEVSYSDEEKQNLKKEAEALKLQGNEEFKKGEYGESAKLYTLGLRTCPLAFSKDRAMMYANRAAAKTKLELKASAIEDCTKAVELDPNYLKAYFRRAQLYEETEKLDEALVDYQKVLELDPLHREALYASKRLPDQINERNEKMKAEMMGKLKDLGNMILRPFGLSTDNFQLTQDPSSGGYSVSFKQNNS